MLRQSGMHQTECCPDLFWQRGTSIAHPLLRSMQVEELQEAAPHWLDCSTKEATGELETTWFSEHGSGHENDGSRVCKNERKVIPFLFVRYTIVSGQGFQSKHGFSLNTFAPQSIPNSTILHTLRQSRTSAFPGTSDLVIFGRGET